MLFAFKAYVAPNDMQDLVRQQQYFKVCLHNSKAGIVCVNMLESCIKETNFDKTVQVLKVLQPMLDNELVAKDAVQYGLVDML